MMVTWREARRDSVSKPSLQIVTELVMVHWEVVAKEMLYPGKVKLVSDVKCHIWSAKQLVMLSYSKAISVSRLKMFAIPESIPHNSLILHKS